MVKIFVAVNGYYGVSRNQVFLFLISIAFKNYNVEHELGRF